MVLFIWLYFFILFTMLIEENEITFYVCVCVKVFIPIIPYTYSLKYLLYGNRCYEVSLRLLLYISKKGTE